MDNEYPEDNLSEEDRETYEVIQHLLQTYGNSHLPGDKDWYRNTYLKSEHWRIRRKKAIDSAGYQCQKCGVQGGARNEHVSLDVHHLNYEHLGFEQFGDLIVLCRKCHDEIHR